MSDTHTYTYIYIYMYTNDIHTYAPPRLRKKKTGLAPRGLTTRGTARQPAMQARKCS